MAANSTDARSKSGGSGTPEPGAPGSRSGEGLGVVRLALWLGLSVWVVEYAILSFRRFVLGDRVVWYIESMWLAALVYVALFFLLGVTAAAIIGRVPRTRRLLIQALTVTAVFCVLLVFTGLHRVAGLILAIGMGARLGSMIVNRDRGASRLVRLSLRPLAGAAALTVVVLASIEPLRAWRAYAALPEMASDAPNVILIILDTVRSRDMGLYGYGRPTTPELEAFARRGVTFDRAIATAPWTLPSHFSMLTGLYPHEMTQGMRLTVRPEMPEGTPYLAEVLRGRGYNTAGFVANMSYTTDESGIHRGFNYWDDHTISPGQLAISTALGRTIVNNGRVRRLFDWYEIPIRKFASGVNGPMLDWLDDHGSRPFFVLANYFDAHDPFLPAPEFERRFARTRPTGATNYHPHLTTRMTLSGNTPEELKAQQDMYDGSIAWLDDELGKLFDELDARGHLENTIVIVTSDHGEAFEEHGKLGHGGDLHMELIRVPLVISFPDRMPAGLRVADPVTLADLPATILDLLDVDEHNMPGRSLATSWDPVNPAVPDSPILAWEGSEGEKGAILLDGWQYIRDAEGRDELYHVAVDTLQLRNLIDDSLAAGTLARMRAALDSAAAISPRERIRSGRAAQLPDQETRLQPIEPPQRQLRPGMD
jgi:arylsulfatase A-like enzyme